MAFVSLTYPKFLLAIKSIIEGNFLCNINEDTYFLLKSHTVHTVIHDLLCKIFLNYMKVMSCIELFYNI
jgi:hypothetical protein